MADQVGAFLSSWKHLIDDDKQKSLATFAEQRQIWATREGEPKVSVKNQSESATAENLRKVYGDIQLYSYYSYLYYYPTMHWTLDKTPDTDDYWVGIYKKGAPDTQYITYQWLKKAAQGSYKIGKLNTTAGEEFRDRTEDFELRIFKGSYQRLDAETNVLRGTIINAPTDPSSAGATQLVASIQSKQLDPEIRDFVRAIETAAELETTGESSSVEDVRAQWNSFTHLQQQLLFPILEQDSLPDEIKKPAAKALDCPEPKVRFATLGKTEPLKTADDPVAAPNKIVLTITLDYGYTYIYPVVDVQQVVPTKWAWMGMYYTESDVSYNPDQYIDNDWQWVGNGEGGSTKLNYIEEKQQGPTNKQYVGAIFDWNGSSYVQIGMAASTIEAAVSATPALPPAIFEPDCDKDEALRYAKLSQLAYQPYATVKQQLPNYNLVAQMQIYDSKTDTNGFIASDEVSVVVAFRGTVVTSWQNLLTDAWFVREHIDEDGQSLVHKGFLTALNAVYTSIEENLKPSLGKKRLFITGHSLGGALATILGYRISRAYNESQPIQYVYGCPPVGDINLATYFKGMDSNTITIQNDPISSGKLILLGEWAGLYKPYQVKYLPATGGHGIADYIQQLNKLP